MASSIVGIGPTWLDRRQKGLKNPLGTKSHIYEQLYSNILPYDSWDPTLSKTYTRLNGGVFSLEFSPEGSLLVAACEKRSFLVFDPLTHKKIHTVENAHLDCVNCVKFLDSRSFATCSDDHTVALWDSRNLSQKVRSLKGHSNWVKNIEYSPQDGLLVTSGFDGSILTWEMNTYREDSSVYKKVFSTNGLMRMHLTPDATKMVMCTTGGYLIIIHNLDLNTMSEDLDGFKPNMYRLMQLSQTIIPVASEFTHLFQGHGKRNRVEFITDFPEGDDAEVISSLQIHPDGHCAISRNVSSNEKSEWSCIHNVEERLSSDELDFADDDGDGTDGSKMISWPGASASLSTTPSCIIQHTAVENERRTTTSRTRSDAGTSTDQNDLSVSPSDVWEALVAIHEARNSRESEVAAAEMSLGHMFRRPEVDPEVQSRPVNFDSQIFVTRILPNLAGATEGERFHGHLSRSAPVFRRSFFIGNDCSRNWTSGVARNFRPGFRKKSLARRRYSSLYRRSLVGQYDRTSILRKSIYNYGTIELKLKKLRACLNTNYELNETRRLKNESEVMGESQSRSQLAGGQSCSQDRSQDARGEQGMLCRNSKSKKQSRRQKVFVNSMCKKRNDRGRCSVNSNRRPCERALTVNDADDEDEDDEDDEDTDNDDGPGDFAVVRGREANPERIASSMLGGIRASGAASSHQEAEANGAVDHEEVVEPETSNSSAERYFRSSSPSTSSAAVSGSPANGSAGKTILMGVFRAGNEDGIRGTSMRKHNVAAVTVSSVGQPETNLSSCENHVERRRKNSTNGNSTRESRTDGTRSSGSTNDNSSSTSSFNCFSQPYPAVPVNRRIHQNTKRLTHYVEEPNLGRGFIKELCISPDGRIICSPFGNGIRLLSFSPTVQDVFHCYPPSPPIPLHELTLNIAHTDIVVSTKFSPFHNLLVSGCLSGKIIYYQPFL